MNLVRSNSDLPRGSTQGNTEAGTEGDTEPETETESKVDSVTTDSVPANADLDLLELGEACPGCLNLDPAHVTREEPDGWYKNDREDIVSFFNDWLHFLGAVRAGECSICPILVEILSFYGLDRGTEDEDELNTSIEVRLPRSEQGNIELVFDGVSGDSIVVQVYVCMSPA
jgi:hypothetical protein